MTKKPTKAQLEVLRAAYEQRLHFVPGRVSEGRLWWRVGNTARYAPANVADAIKRRKWLDVRGTPTLTSPGLAALEAAEANQ